jgi:5-formyltetrahydrofolate cyclo-ligase
MEIQGSKTELRRAIRARTKAMAPEQRAVASRQACALLEQQTVWKRAQSIFFYAPTPEEMDIWPLLGDSLAAGKTVALPRFDAATNRYVACQIQDIAKDLGDGQFGIREPGGHCIAIPPNRLDLILVPGVAFDRHGRRLGRGKGFYDQLLTSVCGTTCGVAFDEQIVEAVPVESHDVHLNCILTPTRWIEPSNARF